MRRVESRSQVVTTMHDPVTHVAVIMTSRHDSRQTEHCDYPSHSERASMKYRNRTRTLSIEDVI